MPNEYKLSITGSQLNTKISEIDKKVSITAQSLTEAQKTQARTNIGAAPIYLYGTEDLEAGVTELETGILYFVYE